MSLYSFDNYANSQRSTNNYNKPKLKIISDHIDNYRTHFEWLYDNYAPKAFGFITKHTDTKEQAEEYMMNVFLKVWENIKTFDKDAEKKIQQIVLMICKPIFKNKYQSN